MKIKYLVFVLTVTLISYLVGGVLGGVPNPADWPYGLKATVVLLWSLFMTVGFIALVREKSYEEFRRRKLERDGADLDLGDLCRRDRRRTYEHR